MAKIIGLTGGIGSGKTTIAKYIHSFGIPLYIADDQARKLMQSQKIIDAIKNIFGEEIFDKEILDRAKLAKIVFNEPEKLEKLNAIIHPAVKSDFKEWLLQYKSAAFIIYEAAILFESGNYKNCDYIITVVAPIDTRIERVMKRDSTSRELIIKRMEAQWTDEQRVAKSDFVIENDNLETAKQKVDEILKILKIKQKPS